MEKNNEKVYTAAIGIIIGILASIVLLIISFPLVRNYSGNKNKVLFNKAYYATQKAMNELVKENVVFEGPFKPEEKNIDQKVVALNKESKFCHAFAKKVGAVGDVKCDQKFAFKTKDGIYWSVPGAFFKGTGRNIIVDVSGDPNAASNVNLNCRYNSINCRFPDQLTMSVLSSGEVKLYGVAERAYAGKNPCRGQRKFKNGICEPLKCKKITEYAWNDSCVKSVCPKGLVFHMGSCYPPGEEPPYKLSERIRLLFE